MAGSNDIEIVLNDGDTHAGATMLTVDPEWQASAVEFVDVL